MIKQETFAAAVKTLAAALPVLSLKRDAAWKAYCEAKEKTASLHLAALAADQAFKDVKSEYVHALNRAAIAGTGSSAQDKANAAWNEACRRENKPRN
jgi:hypothetical protein